MTTLAITCVLTAGCQDTRFSRTIINPLNLQLPFLPYEHPVLIGLVHDGSGIFDPKDWDLDAIPQLGEPTTPLQKQLQKRLRRPISFQQLKPFQAAAHLMSGRVDFACFGAADFVHMEEQYGEIGEVIAVTEILLRRGLIVANVYSDINELSQIRGQRFSFGPRGDPVLDLAAKATLAEAGILPDDLKKEMLPIPNSLQYHLSANESAFEVVYGLGTSVGVIEEADYESYPPSGGNVLLRKFAKDNFRVLAKTAPHRVETIERGPLVASTRADRELIDAVQAELLDMSASQPAALAAMGLAAFHPPPDDVRAAMRTLAEQSSGESALDTAVNAPSTR
jgi:ABC-type phosphate/phosphonate transport system substrate-binding protein